MNEQKVSEAKWVEPGEHCQNGGDVCLAGNASGICCPDDSCDIDDGLTARDPRRLRKGAPVTTGEPNLKPCPFCGSDGRMYGYGACELACCPNGCIAGLTVEKWNRRQSASGEIEALEAGAEFLAERATKLRGVGAVTDAKMRNAQATTLRHMAARMK